MKLGETVDILITRQESGIDKACDLAYDRALLKFGVDDFGQSDDVEGWNSLSCWVEMDMVQYKRVGDRHYYAFKAVALKAEIE